MTLRIYLAGPDVFMPDAVAVGRAKVSLCQRFGWEGLFPLDNEPVDPSQSPAAAGHAIYAGNVGMMRSSDVIVANLSPFRGASADVGTVFEVGFFAALGRPVFAYSNDPRGFAERTRAALALAADAARDADGNAIEPFDLPDNLMLPGAVAASGGSWTARAEPPGRRALAAFVAFEATLEAVRAYAAPRASAAA